MSNEYFRKKIIEQLEFYFSPANLNKDLFIQRMSRQHDGYLPIRCLLKFGVIKDYLSKMSVGGDAARTAVLLECIKTMPILQLSLKEVSVKRKDFQMDYSAQLANPYHESFTPYTDY